MFYSKGRLASSDRVGLAICVAHSLLSHQRLRNGHMFVCRPDEPVGYLIAIITLIHTMTSLRLIAGMLAP